MNPDAIRIWYEALASPLGIKFTAPDLTRAKSLLYAARAKLNDPDLMNLTLRTSPRSPTDTLWILKA